MGRAMDKRPAWRRAASRGRKLAYRSLSIAETMLGRSGPLTPPAHLRAEYYRTLNRDAFERACVSARVEVLSHGLQPGHRILDVGCGIGNLAVGLREYLTGSYEGIDIVPSAVEWCQRAITPRYPRFRFDHADVSSAAYNPHGAVNASGFTFPFPGADFDFVFLGSVFTHMFPDEVQHYLKEIRRVLRPSGTCAASFFLIDDERRPAIDAGRSFLSFALRHPSGAARYHDERKPEAAVALEERFVRTAHAAAGLAIDTIRRGGWWNGRSDDQDVVRASVLRDA
jgi:SAM-dependent methyltransferase